MKTQHMIILMAIFSVVCLVIIDYIKTANLHNGHIIILVVGILYSIPCAYTVKRVIVDVRTYSMLE